MLLRNHAPACVASTSRARFLHSWQNRKYLELPAGDATLNLVRAARDGLKIELANALRKVVAKRKPVRYEGLEVRVNGGFEVVNVTVELADGADRAANVIIVTFQDGQPKAARESAPAASRRPPQINKPPDEKDRHIAAARTRVAREDRGAPKRRSRRWKLPTRSLNRPTRNSNPLTKSFSPRMKSWRPRRRSCNRSTKSWSRSTPSYSKRWRACLASITT